MIILLSRSGQTCNQLLSIASAYVLGLEHNEEVLCPVIDEHIKEFFEFNRKNVNDKVKMYHSGFWEALRKISGIYRKCAKKDEIFLRFNKECRILLDWISFKEDEVFVEHLTEVRDFFKFKKNIVENCKGILDSRVDEKKIRVGIHMRRGDYKNFQGGKWYYSDENYARWMKVLVQNKDVQFVLFSNEVMNISYFEEQGLNVIGMQGSAIEDLCCLSMCDYIMGPPSTYSWWAAMYGNKRRLILENRDTEYQWKDFKYLEERVAEGKDEY